MSLVCLKRISQTRYIDKVSHDQPNGFSIYGGNRNTSYIGQTSLSKKNRVPTSSRNGGPKGAGGDMLVTNEIFMNCCKNDSTIVKPSVKSTRGMLADRLRGTRYSSHMNIVQPDTNIRENHGQSAYIEQLRLSTNCVTKDIYYLSQTAEQATRAKVRTCLSVETYPTRVNNQGCFTK
jgi:hypothetical protein